MRLKSFALGGGLGFLLLLGLSWYGARQRTTSAPATPPAAPREAAPPARVATPGDALLAQLFREHRSNVEVEAAGTVNRTLPDDSQGARHQRFIVRLASGQTLLFAHNLDLAPRVPVARGDHIRFRGQYEWSDRGGVVHWTHRDPSGHHPDGWIEAGGHVYR